MPVLVQRSSSAPFDDVAGNRQSGALQLLPDDEALIRGEQVKVAKHGQHEGVTIMVGSELLRVSTHEAADSMSRAERATQCRL